MNGFERTGFRPVDPTTLVYDSYPRENTTPAPNPYTDDTGIPPPPPCIKRRRSRKLLWIALVVAILLALSSCLFYLARSLLCQARFVTSGCCPTRLLVKRIQPLQFDARISSGELPMHGGA